jgi:hypothetical protein
MLKNKNKILVLLLAFLVVVLALVLIITQLGDKTKTLKNNHYSVVYLTTGEVYVGELATFPRMQLKNGYLLATGQDPTDPKKTTFQLNPLSETIWSPKKIYLNREQVVFYGPLLETSRVAQTLAGQAK